MAKKGEDVPCSRKPGVGHDAMDPVAPSTRPDYAAALSGNVSACALGSHANILMGSILRSRLLYAKPLRCWQDWVLHHEVSGSALRYVTLPP
jgi:hypothetical protein